MTNIILTLLVMLCATTCCEEEPENEEVRIVATIIFINETSDFVAYEKELHETNIAPGNTYQINIEYYANKRPKVDDFPINSYVSYMTYKNGNVSTCEDGISNIMNYENKKEIAPLIFEFTYRFTENKKAKANPIPCASN